jgi:L-threonylcarbamoyladenylate synthase
MKYRHYAPKAPVTAVLGPPGETAEYIKRRMGEGCAALMFDDFKLDLPCVVAYGPSWDHAALAARLFDALRELDGMGASAIYAQSPAEVGLGQAVDLRIEPLQKPVILKERSD